jgi:hypothetical protein
VLVIAYATTDAYAAAEDSLRGRYEYEWRRGKKKAYVAPVDIPGENYRLRVQVEAAAQALMLACGKLEQLTISFGPARKTLGMPGMLGVDVLDLELDGLGRVQVGLRRNPGEIEDGQFEVALGRALPKRRSLRGVPAILTPLMSVRGVKSVRIKGELGDGLRDDLVAAMTSVS